MQAALASTQPAGATLSEPEGGFFSWLTLPDGWSTDALLDAAVEERVVFVPCASFCAPGKGQRELRLAFSFESPARIEEVTRRLGRAFARLAPTR